MPDRAQRLTRSGAGAFLRPSEESDILLLPLVVYLKIFRVQVFRGMTRLSFTTTLSRAADGH